MQWMLPALRTTSREVTPTTCAQESSHSHHCRAASCARDAAVLEISLVLTSLIARSYQLVARHSIAMTKMLCLEGEFTCSQRAKPFGASHTV